MEKTYYRSEYTEKQWKALIDKATELGCHVAYDRYGGYVKINSTMLENNLCKTYPKAISTVRHEWAERIHEVLQESAGIRKWKVQPKVYRLGYCPTICKTQKSAREQQERLERITGFEWTITVISE